MNDKRRTPLDALGGLLITAVAVALLAPGFASLRDQRAAEGCLTNLQRIGTAARMYEDDYDGKLVPYAISISSGAGTYSYSARYTKLLYPYLRDARVFSCPADHLDETKMADSAPYPSTYGVNWYISQWAGTRVSSTYPGRHRSFVKDPVRTIWAADSAAIDATTKDLPAEQWREDLKQAPTADIYYFYLPQNPLTGAGYSWSNPNFTGFFIRPFPRHSGRVNVCYYDGHSGSVPASQFDPAVTKWGTPECLWDNPIP